MLAILPLSQTYAMADPNTLGLHEMPEDVVLEVAQFLPPLDVLALSVACKDLLFLRREQLTWKRLYETTFGEHPQARKDFLGEGRFSWAEEFFWRLSVKKPLVATFNKFKTVEDGVKWLISTGMVPPHGEDVFAFVTGQPGVSKKHLGMYLARAEHGPRTPILPRPAPIEGDGEGAEDGGDEGEGEAAEGNDDAVFGGGGDAFQAVYLADDQAFAPSDALPRYMANYDFAGLSIVDSLRAFFTLMHIPSSSAGIKTILHAVAEAYVEQNAGGVDDVALDAEAVYLVYYSVLMINTDIHNITVKNKMPRDRFIDSVTDILNGALARGEILALYDEIAARALDMHGGDATVRVAVAETKSHGMIMNSWVERGIRLSSTALEIFPTATLPDVEGGDVDVQPARMSNQSLDITVGPISSKRPWGVTITARDPNPRLKWTTDDTASAYDGRAFELSFSGPDERDAWAEDLRLYLDRDYVPDLFCSH